MKRRTALRHIGTGLSAGLVLPWLSSCKDNEIDPQFTYDGMVGIIGAGASGLYAGDYLLTNGINVEILEASERIGGRVRTLRAFDNPGPGLWFNPNSSLSPDFPIELGADRILGENSIWSKFVDIQKYATFGLPAKENDIFWINDALLDYAAASAIPEFQNAENLVMGLPSMTGSSSSVQQHILNSGIDAAYFDILEGWVANKYGTGNARLGVNGIAEAYGLAQRTGNNRLLANNPMADVLVGSFIRAADKVQLNTVVRSIDYSGDKVVVSGEKFVDGVAQPFTATYDKVIVTVPATVLKDGDITFSPALPSAKASALTKIEMDTSIRVVLDFRKKFWDDNLRDIYGGEKGREYFNPGTSGRSTVARALTVTVSGERAEELSALGLEIIPTLLTELDAMFDGQASENIRRDSTAEGNYIAVVQDWGKEPFIRGSMSYLKPGSSVDIRENLGNPVRDVLFFAGEATDITGEAGTINGALKSAERAAAEVVSAIKGV